MTPGLHFRRLRTQAELERAAPGSGLWDWLWRELQRLDKEIGNV